MELVMSGNINLKPSKPDGDFLGNLSIPGNSHFALVCKAVEKISLPVFEAIVASIRSTVLEGGRIYIFGNGGSASTAGHIVTDLAQCTVGGRSIRAHSFADNPAIITAWANDVRFEQVFAAEVDRYVNTQDIVVAISVSGRSPNILAALRRARAAGARTVALLGADGGLAADMVDIALVVPSVDYGVVEVAHLAIAHALADALRGGVRRVAGVFEHETQTSTAD
jgi:D-sedoheptulose 7-phosphate isomerase